MMSSNVTMFVVLKHLLRHYRVLCSDLYRDLFTVHLVVSARSAKWGLNKSNYKQSSLRVIDVLQISLQGLKMYFCCYNLQFPSFLSIFLSINCLTIEIFFTFVEALFVRVMVRNPLKLPLHLSSIYMHWRFKQQGEDEYNQNSKVGVLTFSYYYSLSRLSK